MNRWAIIHAGISNFKEFHGTEEEARLNVYGNDLLLPLPNHVSHLSHIYDGVDFVLRPAPTPESDLNQSPNEEA